MEFQELEGLQSLFFKFNGKYYNLIYFIDYLYFNEFHQVTNFVYDKEAIEESSEENKSYFEKGFLYTDFTMDKEAMVGFDQYEILENFEDDGDMLSDEEKDSEGDNEQQENVIFQQLAEDIRQIIQEALKDPPKTDHSTVEIHNLKVAENIEGWRVIQIFVSEIFSDLVTKFKEIANPQERIGAMKTVKHDALFQLLINKFKYIRYYEIITKDLQQNYNFSNYQNQKLLSNWNKLFKKFVHSDEDSLIFIQEIELLFQDEILTKEYILNWVEERRKESNEDQQHFLTLCKDFIAWLESDDDDEEEDEDEGEDED